MRLWPAIAPNGNREFRSAALRMGERIKKLSLLTVLGVMTLGLAWSTSGRYMPWPSFRQEVLATVALFLLAGAALSTSRTVAWPRLAFAAAILALVPLAQWASGLIVFFDDALLCSLYLAGFAIAVSIGASLEASRLSKQLMFGLVACIVGSGVLASGSAISQWLGPDVLANWVNPLSRFARPSANTGQPNHLATQLMIGVACILYLHAKRFVAGWCAALAIAWLACGVVVTQSRTAWLAVALTAIWWLGMRRRAALPADGRAAFVGIALFVVAVRCLGPLQDLWSGPVDPSAASEVRVLAGTRPMHWQMLVGALLGSPWAGYGWNQVANAQSDIAADFAAIREPIRHSHNLVLDLLLYNGIPLGLVICAALVAWLFRRVRECRDAESWLLLLLLFDLFLHAMLELPLHYAYYLLPAGFAMGMLATRGTSSVPTRRWPRLSLAIPALLLSVLTGAIAAQYLAAEEALRELELSVRGIGEPPDKLARVAWPLLESWAAYYRAATVKVESTMPTAELENIRTVASRYPYPNILERFAQALTLTGDPVNARTPLLLSCKLHTTAVCDGMRRRWNRFRSENSGSASVDFPGVDELRNPELR